MLNFQNIVIDAFVKELTLAYQRTYGLVEPQYINIIKWSACFALENIANSDALYHNVEHTVVVTLAGQEILRGKHLSEGGVKPDDWLHFIIALLCHDIGYVKGICRDDKHGEYAVREGETQKIDPGKSCASLAPYHVDRSMLFVKERFGSNMIMDVINVDRLLSFIEMTRFPVPEESADTDTKSLPGLVRAADFIGQLGDPDYLRKIPALFYEFEETGANKPMGYSLPGDMRKSYARFYWDVVSPYISDGLEYLKITQEGKLWVSNLNSHVFTIEHEQK